MELAQYLEVECGGEQLAAIAPLIAFAEMNE